MTAGFLLAIDQGTTGSRAILYDSQGKAKARAYREFSQHYPQPAWVEHNPLEIWKSVLDVSASALHQAGVSSSKISGIAITNQRETTVLWDRKTGKPVYPAIVWQDRRTSEVTDGLKKKGFEPIFRERTGLVLDPYFSGSKIKWLLDHVPGLRKKAENGNILFGTIDSWILWKLTGGMWHATDYTNAARTLVFNIHRRAWDKDLLKIFKIPSEILPEAFDSAAGFGKTIKQGCFSAGIPILALMGDQQAALYGQSCYHVGDSKNTYGTGCFVVTNMGHYSRKTPFGLLETLACDQEGRSVYAFEGSIFIAGAAIQWVRDGLGLIKNAGESEKIALTLKDNGGVTVIPAFAGLGSPYWNPNVRGVIAGITRGTTRAHLIRATLESIAQQTSDVLDSIHTSTGTRIKALKVDGGATANRFLMQFQADLLGTPVLVSDIAESTAWGVAKLAGYKAGFWPSLKSLDRRRRYKCFSPKMSPTRRRLLRDQWKREIKRLIAA